MTEIDECKRNMPNIEVLLTFQQRKLLSDALVDSALTMLKKGSTSAAAEVVDSLLKLNNQFLNR